MHTCSLLYNCIFLPLFSSFSFWCIQTVYTAYEHCISLEFPRNMTYWHMLPGYSIFHQVYIRYYCILRKFQHITGLISYGWYSEIYSSHCISLLYYCTLMSTHFHCIYSLYTMNTLCWHCHIGFTYTKSIHMLYLWYISLHTQLRSVFNMYTSGFIFLGCLYDYCTFMLFQT